jgi:hypothetical protein
VASRLDPSSNARAVREHRQRLSNGRRVVPVEIGEDDEELLITMNCLASQSTDDRKAVGHAIEKLLTIIRAERG